MENKQIKNTAPAVMTDTGPYNTPRNKSADGRYTAGAAGYNLEKQADDAPGTDKKWMEKNKIDFNNFESFLDKRIYTPLFTKMVETFFMPLHIAINKRDKNHVPFIMRTNKYYDEELGVDFAFGSKNDEGYVNKGFVTTDLKVVDTFGDNNKKYENPNIPLNLWKKNAGENEEWKPGSFLNENHINLFYTYICPKSVVSKNYLKKQNAYADPEITEAKIVHIKKENLETFVMDKIISSPGYEQALNSLKEAVKDNTEDKTSIDIPVAGEDFKARMFIVRDKKGNASIRMSLPYSAFEVKKIKADIVKTIPIDNLFKK